MAENAGVIVGQASKVELESQRKESHISDDSLVHEHVRKEQNQEKFESYNDKESHKKLTQAVNNLRHTVISILQVDAFDILHSYSDVVIKRIQKQQARSQVLEARRLLRCWKEGIRQQKLEKQSLQKAQLYRQKRLGRMKKVLFRKMKKIVQIEKEWLQRVKKEFALTKLDSAWEAWQIFVKYQKVKRNRREAICYHFLKQLYHMSEQTQSQIADLKQAHNTLMLRACFNNLKQHVPQHQHRLKQKQKADIFRQRQLTQLGLQTIKENQSHNSEVKRDVFLRQASLQHNGFMTIGVHKRSGLSETVQRQKRSQQEMFQLTQAEMINIQIIQ